jgi:hypothetical protein
MSSAAFCTWEITDAAMCGSHCAPLLGDRRAFAEWYVAIVARHTKWMLRDDRIRRRPYSVECTGSLLASEVKRRRAWLALGWGTAREELRVLSAIHIIYTHVLFLKWVPYTQGAIGFPNGFALRHFESDTRTSRASRPASQPDLPFYPIPLIYSKPFHSLSAIHPIHNFKYAQH